MTKPIFPPHVWIVIPAFNEEKYIEDVLRKIETYTDQIIVVDDGSRDQTFGLAQKFAQYSLRHPLNLGKGATLKTGCEFAFGHLGAEAVILMDSDDQHDPVELPVFLQKLQEGNQVVFGARQIHGDMPLLRAFFNRFASLLILILFGRYIQDIPSGYKALSRSAYEKLKWNARDYAVEMEIAARTAKSTLQFTTTPIKTIYHDFNRGMTHLDMLKMFSQIIAWRIEL
jgi:glycosyltransferase involved in cell wall biosynthesis